MSVVWPWRLSSGYRRLSTLEKSHPEWNGDVRVKRQTRPRSKVGIQILAKYPAVISRRRKNVFRRWRLMHESGIATEWQVYWQCCVFCAPIIRRTNSRVEHCRQWLIWLKTSELTIFTFYRSCIKINSRPIYRPLIRRHLCSDFALCNITPATMLLRQKWWFQRKFAW